MRDSLDLCLNMHHDPDGLFKGHPSKAASSSPHADSEERRSRNSEVFRLVQICVMCLPTGLICITPREDFFFEGTPLDFLI